MIVKKEKMCYNCKALRIMEEKMIDIDKVENKFQEYVSKFNSKQGRIKLKIDHIKRVAEISEMLAKYLKLNEEQTRLAKAIGIFHDIGRFKQVEMYNTFSDKDSINHAELGVKILFDENLIEDFGIEEKYKKIIKLAILNHNKDKIEEGLTEEENLFCKIIRDADKLDIYYVLTIEKLENSYGCKDMSKDEITDEIYREFMEDHMINYKNLKTNADMLVAHIAYIFDFYYNYSLKIVKQKGYIEQIEQKVNLENKQAIKLLEKINVIANNYIDETLKLEQREQVQCQKSC